MDQTLPEVSQTVPQQRHKPGGAAAAGLLVLATAGFTGWVVLSVVGFDANRYAVALIALFPYAPVVGVVLALAGLLLRRWPVVLCAVLATAVSGGALAPRVLADGPPQGGGEPLRVLSINTYYGSASAEEIVRLVASNRVDVLSLQELTPELVAELDRAGLAAELPHRVFQAGPHATGSGLASRYPLQETSLVEGTANRQPSALVELPGGATVEVVAVHARYPMGKNTTPTWRSDMAALPDPVDGAVPRLLVGDFNATLDHTPLRELVDRGYRDAAARTGRGWLPTWPEEGTLLPPPVTIDHVLCGGGLQARDFRVLPVPGADHRAVFTEVLVGR